MHHQSKLRMIFVQWRILQYYFFLTSSFVWNHIWIDVMFWLQWYVTFLTPYLSKKFAISREKSADMTYILQSCAYVRVFICLFLSTMTKPMFRHRNNFCFQKEKRKKNTLHTDDKGVIYKFTAVMHLCIFYLAQRLCSERKKDVFEEMYQIWL